MVAPTLTCMWRGMPAGMQTYSVNRKQSHANKTNLCWYLSYGVRYPTYKEEDSGNVTASLIKLDFVAI